MSDLLNHLVRWMSDGLRPGFPDDVPVRMWSWLEPHDPRSGSDRGRRPAALEAREQVIRPRPPWGRVAAATLGLIEARDLLVPSRERVRILESRDHLDRLEQMRFRLRPVAALREHEAQVRLAVDRATGSPIVSASRTARSALAAAASTDPSRRKLSTAFASAYDAKRTSPAPRAISADRANVSAAVRVSPSRLETIPRLIWIAASSLVPLRTDEAASRRRVFARAWSPRAIRTAPRSVSARTRSREPWGKRSAARSRCPIAAGRSPSFLSTPPRARNASPSTSGTASAEASRTASARIVRASA